MKRLLFLLWLLAAEIEAEVYRFNLENRQSLRAHRSELRQALHFLNLRERKKCIDDFNAFLNGYFSFIKALEIRGKHIFFHMQNGKKILYDDDQKRDFLLKLSDSTLKDVLSQPYDLGPVRRRKKRNDDPGRFRNYVLLGCVYGETRAEIEKNLVPMEFVGTKIRFNAKNGAVDALRQVSHDLQELLKRRPAYGWYFKNIGGTYAYRKIRDSENLSSHAYGIAIDLRLKKPYYWKNTAAEYEKGEPWQRTLPRAIVKIFEKYHFIWGGKWNHYDRIHFEYRPEFFYKIKRR